MAYVSKEKAKEVRKTLNINQKITLKGMMTNKSVFNHIKYSSKKMKRFYEILENGNGWCEVRLSFFDTQFRCINPLKR